AFRIPRAITTPLNQRLTRSMHSVDDAVLRAITLRRTSGGGERRDLLDAMLAVRDPEDGDALDDAAIRAEIKGLLAAGIDTTASALTRTVELLTAHPDVAGSWHSELDRQLDRRLPERHDLPGLTRLTQIV